MGVALPEYFIQQNTGKSPAEFFGAEMHFSGSHVTYWYFEVELIIELVSFP